MRGPIKLSIEREGQPYVDELIYVRTVEDKIQESIRSIFGRRLPRPIVVGFNRRPLIWSKR